MSGATDSRVGVLGTGLMGTAMAHRLLNQGVPVIAWDRAPDHARPLAERGAEVARTAGGVVGSAQAVITMLPTAEIVLSVVEPLLDEWPEETIWLQMSSVGAAEAWFAKAWAAAPKKGGRLRAGISWGSTTNSLDPGTYLDNYMFTVGLTIAYGFVR